MRTSWNIRTSAFVVFFLGFLIAATIGERRPAAAQGNPEAAKLTNPVAATPQSIEAGKKTYGKFCAFCHGEEGKGDGPMAPEGSHPADLTAAQWKHGGSDGELFSTISNGAGPKSAMKPFKSKLTPNEIWNVVNYVRTLAKN
jgi:mono/diheme cytochrome c family protein